MYDYKYYCQRSIIQKRESEENSKKNFTQNKKQKCKNCGIVIFLIFEEASSATFKIKIFASLKSYNY